MAPFLKPSAATRSQRVPGLTLDLVTSGWLEADQAELTLLHRPEAEGALKATAYRFCAWRAGLEPTGTFAFVRA